MALKLHTYQLRLAYRMEQLGCSIQELAEAVGKTPSAVHAWQRTGSKRVPKIASRRKIAAYLHCDPDWLLSGHGEPPEPPHVAPDAPGRSEDDFDTSDAPSAPSAPGATSYSSPAGETVAATIRTLMAQIAFANDARIDEIEISYQIKRRLIVGGEVRS